MKRESKEYYAARERAERMAAENATCPEAKASHEELARAYARLAEDTQPDAQRPAA
jgi:hypothetical protein